MALFRGSIRSKVLDMDTTVNVCVPYDKYDPLTGEQLSRCDKTLILLHGLRQNADAWPRMSGMEQAAYQYGFCVVMPEVQRSFYTDMAQGLSYFTYLNEELPWLLGEVFRLPLTHERLYVGGLSMGGYGALKCALTYPDRFAGAMCFSSGFYMLEDMPLLLESGAYKVGELQGILGPELSLKPDDDMDALIREAARHSAPPRLYLACGSEDYLREKNLRMRDSLSSAGLPLLYEEWPGAHDWKFWDAALLRGMAHMAGE